MSDKVAARHLNRSAILYVRQSTPQQLQHNEESRRLQYAMRERLFALGWKDIVVIDDDLGRTASGVVERAGFERLVAQVSLGEVGAVGARELSRFARNSREWQKLIEVCRYVDTLLVDQDTVYDARLGNDRLLLGLKGSLNEYELDLLRLRAQEARREKARRGEFFAKVAVGYRRSEMGVFEKTPDIRVQRAITLAFDKFLELGSARQAFLWFREHELEMPVNRSHRGNVVWKPPGQSWIYQVLTNPVYAGAYAYGRSAVQTVLVDGEPRQRTMRRERDAWAVLIRDHHEAYIDWDRFERIQAMLSKNSQIRRATAPGAAKNGSALLGGLVRCRRCANKLIVNYSGAAATVRRYQCDRANQDHGDPRCINFSAIDVDDRVASFVLDVVRPAFVEASLRAAHEEVHAQDAVAEALRLEREAADYAAERAFRQYDASDPENRLVTSELERRWNQALIRVREIDERLGEYQRRRDENRPKIDVASFASLSTDLLRVWEHPSTDVRLKKRIIRTLIEEVVADVDDAASEIVLMVHWKGGVHTELRVPKRRIGQNRHQTPVDTVEAIRALACVCTDDEIAAWLTKAGLRTGKGNHWTRALVAALRSGRHIPAFSEERCQAEGWITLEKGAALVGVASLTLKRAVERGVIPAQQPLPGGPWLFRRDELMRPEVKARLYKGRGPRPEAGAAPVVNQLSLAIPRR